MEECILLADTKHSQSHINVYQEVIFFSWGGKSLHKVELLMILLLSASIASLRTPSYGWLNMLLCSSMENNCNKNVVTNCGTLDRQCIIWYNNLILETPQPEDVVESNYNDIFDLLIFIYPHLFGILDHNIIPNMIALSFDLAAQNLWTPY